MSEALETLASKLVSTISDDDRDSHKEAVMVPLSIVAVNMLALLLREGLENFSNVLVIGNYDDGTSVVHD